MVKIGKRKKKGRPPKADLDRRVGLGPDPRRSPHPREAQVRRSTRRRSITYVEDFYDDSLDEEEEEEEVAIEEEDEEEQVDEEDEDDDDEDERREKKLKLVVKVANTTREKLSSSKRVDSLSRNGSAREISTGHVSAPESSCSDDNKPFKKRKMDDDDGVNEEEEEEEDDDEDDEDVTTVRTRNQKKKNSKTNGVSKRLDPIQSQGKPVDSSSKGRRRVLPEKQLLEMILDKLQKKDTYGVYAEPVDPEELPDYHDVIEHPMDFGTVRNKLANGAYSTMEEFESDVYLICTNAMHYNAPETVYYKQARTIQELARKKFERLRIEYENPVEELKIDETVKPTSTVKKPIKRSACKTIHESVASDFCSGATLATPGDKCTLPNVTQAGGYEKPGVVDGQVDGNSSLTENKPEKTEEQHTGKVFPSKLGRKPFAVDENRRVVAHNSSTQPDVRSESMCTIFEGEKVQLVSVGLHADHSYARSLARFAATLGPVAWRVASRKIEQAVPSGIKFGRGWVGEYEPLSTPVLMLENCKEKQTGSSWDAKSRKDDMMIAKSTKDEKTVVGMKVRSEPIPRAVQMNENQMQWQKDKISQGKVESGKQNCVEKSKVHQNDMQLGPKTSSGMITSSKLQDTAKERHFTNPTGSEGKPGFFGLSRSKINGNYQQNVSSMKDMKSENTVLKQVELHHSVPTSTNNNGIVPKKHLDNNSEMTSSRLMEVVSRNRNLVQSAPYKPLESDGVASGRVSNGRGSSMSINNNVSSLPYAISSSQQPRAAVYFPQGNHRQGLSDPVQMMRMLAEKNNNQQKSLNLAANGGAQMTPSSDSSRRDDTSAAAATAARAWMTLGAAAHLKPVDVSGLPKQQIAASSLYNSANEEVPHSVSQNPEEPLLSRVHMQSDNNKFPPQMFLPQPTRSGDESRFLNNRQMAFPPLVTTDLSRFQAQSPWQGLVPHAQPKKQDSLPPDLNISFQPPASPVKQSSGAMIDSQQPDLALQL